MVVDDGKTSIGDHALDRLRDRGVIPQEEVARSVVAVVNYLGTPAWRGWTPFGLSTPMRRRTTASLRPTQAITCRENPTSRDVLPRRPALQSDTTDCVTNGPRSAAILFKDLVAGAVMPGTVSAEEHRSLLRLCGLRSRTSLAAVQRLVDIGNMKRAKRERRQHLRRPEVLLYALLYAARLRWPTKTDISAVERERLRQKQLTEAIKRLPDVGKFDRPARGRRWLMPKRDGGQRPITNFFWVDHARQIVLRSALTPFANLHEGQAMLARDSDRRGPATVRKTLLRTLEESGEDSVFMQFDVVDFYGSISHEWLEGHLGIDPAIVRKHVHTGGMLIESVRGMTTVRDDREASRKKETGRRGIPQGSASSPLIAEQVMAAVIRSVAVLRNLWLRTWSDNLGVIVPRREAENVENLVRAAFAEHGAGPFKLKLKSDPVTQEFKFLGVWYQKGPHGARAFVPHAVADAWEARITGDILLALTTARLNEIEGYVRSKIAQWRWWSGAAELEAYLLRMIGTARETIGGRFSLTG